MNPNNKTAEASNASELSQIPRNRAERRAKLRKIKEQVPPGRRGGVAALKRLARALRIAAGIQPDNVVDWINEQPETIAARLRLHPTKGWRREPRI